jgi:hypothetical protein
MNTFIYGVFVSPHGGLGGPPSFFLAVGSGGFCFSSVIIACLM